jgi:hypothetical protein
MLHGGDSVDTAPGNPICCGHQEKLVLSFCQRIAPTRNKITKISRIVAMDVMPPLPGPHLEYP